LLLHLGKVSNFKQGVKMAAELIDTQRVKCKLSEFKEFLEENA